MPAATLVMRRSLPGEPTDTVFGWVAIEPAPRATELAPMALDPKPSAVPLVPVTEALAPMATPLSALAATYEFAPTAVDGSARACAW